MAQRSTPSPWSFHAFANAVEDAFLRTFQWRGRTHRAGFWWFAAFQSLVALFTTLVLDPLGLMRAGMLLSLIVAVPRFTLNARRLHDIGWSGLWWLGILVGQILLTFLAFAIFLGALMSENTRHISDWLLPVGGAMLLSWLFLTVLMMRRGDPKPNRYGPPPSP